MTEITKEQMLKVEIYDILERESILQIQMKNLNEHKQKKMEELSVLRRSLSDQSKEVK
jgi:hypothetical protein